MKGSYYEACNCDAVCPCRREGDRQGGPSTYDTCDFALSWKVDDGHFDGRDLSGLSTVIVGSYSDDEPGSPWRVAVLIDETADEARQQDLADIFLGRISGDTQRMYGRMIKEVTMVRTAAIKLVHEPGKWRIGVSTFVEARSSVLADADGIVTCGLTADVDGTEMIADVLTVAVPPFEWNIRERCSFQSPFAYQG